MNEKRAIVLIYLHHIRKRLQYNLSLNLFHEEYVKSIAFPGVYIEKNLSSFTRSKDESSADTQMYAIFLPHKCVVAHDLFEYLISEKKKEEKKVILYPLLYFSVFLHSLPKVWLHKILYI